MAFPEFFALWQIAQLSQILTVSLPATGKVGKVFTIIGYVMIPLVTPAPPQPLTKPDDQRNQDALHKAARDLEAGFIAEMLKSAGFGKARDGFGGGAGEDGFTSFLVNAQAETIADAGGFGLAEHIFNALHAREVDHAKSGS